MFYISDLYKIKNILPIIYTADDVNSVCKLIMLYPRIKERYKNINLFFVFHDLIQKQFPFEFIMSDSDFQKYKKNFAKYYYLDSNEKNDIISKFCFDNNLNLFFCNSATQNINNIYYTKTDHRNLISKKINANFIQINSLMDATNNMFAIAGEESPNLLTLASIGRKIVLISPKNNNSFQKMFPDTIEIK